MKDYTEMKNHRCNYCDKSFSQPGYLKSHEKRTHEKSFASCKLCGNTFHSKADIQRHMKRVHEENPKTCM